MVGTAAALLGSSAISAGTSILGGLLGKSAAQKAAEAQQKAAAEAGQKVEGAVRDSNPQIVDNAAKASDMALRAGGVVTDTASAAGRNLVDASAGANALLNPYATTGATATETLNKGLSDGGQFTKTPTLADIQIDPGFQFRINEATKVLNRSAAARGGAVSGEALKTLDTYTQDAASQEYANAFGRYNTTRQNTFSNLMAASNQGQAAAGKMGDNTLGAVGQAGTWNIGAANTNLAANEFAGNETYDAAKTTANNTIRGAEVAGDYLTQGANAKAAGIVGGSNALTSGLTGAAGAVSNGVMLNALLKNPATSGGGYGPTVPIPTVLGTAAKNPPATQYWPGTNIPRS